MQSQVLEDLAELSYLVGSMIRRSVGVHYHQGPARLASYYVGSMCPKATNRLAVGGLGALTELSRQRGQQVPQVGLMEDHRNHNFPTVFEHVITVTQFG